MRELIIAAALLAPITLLGACATGGPYDKPGFATVVDDGRLWVFEVPSKAWTDYQNGIEPGKIASAIGAGPDGMTIKAPNQKVLDAYLKAQ